MTVSPPSWKQGIKGEVVDTGSGVFQVNFVVNILSVDQEAGRPTVLLRTCLTRLTTAARHKAWLDSTYLKKAGIEQCQVGPTLYYSNTIHSICRLVPNHHKHVF